MHVILMHHKPTALQVELKFLSYLGFELWFPRNLDKVDANTIRNNQCGKISNISGRDQELQALHCSHSMLLLPKRTQLMFKKKMNSDFLWCISSTSTRNWYLLLLTTGWERNKGVDPPVKTTNCKPHQHHNAHHSLQRDGPAINSGAKIFPQIGEVLHCSTGEYKGNICTKPEERIEFFGLINRCNLREMVKLVHKGLKGN